MKRIDDMRLTANQQQALNELKNKLFGAFAVETLALYGSAARGEIDDESDFDLLVVTKYPLSRFVRHQITDLVFDINLRYATNFSAVVMDRESWETGVFSVLPFREEVLKDSVYL